MSKQKANIGLIIAMEEELAAVKNFCINNNILLNNIENTFNLNLFNLTYNNHTITVAISKIGKAAAAIATTILITHYSCDFIINLGSCGGLNNTPVGAVVLSDSSGYTDVDVTAFGYELGQLPQQPNIFTSANNYYSLNNLLNKLAGNSNIVVGTVICNDSFIANKEVVEKIKKIYPQTKAVDMESTAIAQTCYLFNKDFLFIKKVSDSADTDAAHSFSTEIQKMNETLPDIIKTILDSIQ